MRYLQIERMFFYLEITAMDKAEFLSLVDAERAAWAHALERVDEAQMLLPGVEGNWTVKDLVAHVIWSEREMVGILESRSLLRGSELWNLSQDERNAIVYAENRERPLAEIVPESREVYSHLRELLGQVTDADLNDPARLGMPPDWIPWQIFAGSTYNHYREHRQALDAWLQRQAP